MLDILTELSTPLSQVILFILGLALLWFLLRVFLRFTIRIFTIGCGLIVLVGLCGLVFLILSRS